MQLSPHDCATVVVEGHDPPAGRPHRAQQRRPELVVARELARHLEHAGLDVAEPRALEQPADLGPRAVLEGLIAHRVRLDGTPRMPSTNRADGSAAETSSAPTRRTSSAVSAPVPAPTSSTRKPGSIAAKSANTGPSTVE